MIRYVIQHTKTGLYYSPMCKTAAWDSRSNTIRRGDTFERKEYARACIERMALGNLTIQEVIVALPSPQ